MSDESLFSKIMAVGVSRSYASQLATGVRTPSLQLAIKIFRGTGTKLGPIHNASDDEIDTLERVAERPKGEAPETGQPVPEDKSRSHLRGAP